MKIGNHQQYRVWEGTSDTQEIQSKSELNVAEGALQRGTRHCRVEDQCT
jgi:hypothetical protein